MSTSAQVQPVQDRSFSATVRADLPIMLPTLATLVALDLLAIPEFVEGRLIGPSIALALGWLLHAAVSRPDRALCSFVPPSVAVPFLAATWLVMIIGAETLPALGSALLGGLLVICCGLLVARYAARQ